MAKQRGVGEGGDGGGEAESDDPFPPFTLLCLGLGAQAQIALGLQPDPVTHETALDLAAARQTIDLLGALEEKTKGNLTPEEHALLQNLLGELRLVYVRAAADAK